MNDFIQDLPQGEDTSTQMDDVVDKPLTGVSTEEEVEDDEQGDEVENISKGSDIFRETYRPLTQGERDRMRDIKRQAVKLYDMLVCDSLREERIAKQKLEEAIMWIIKGITK